LRGRQRDETERSGEKERQRSRERSEVDPTWIDAGDLSSDRCYRWVDSGGTQELEPVTREPNLTNPGEPV
jgi:hypothetical protein